MSCVSIDRLNSSPTVVSNLEGTFTLRDAKLTFSSLRFLVPGAVVDLAG